MSRDLQLVTDVTNMVARAGHSRPGAISEDTSVNELISHEFYPVLSAVLSSTDGGPGINMFCERPVFVACHHNFPFLTSTKACSMSSLNNSKATPTLPSYRIGVRAMNPFHQAQSPMLRFSNSPGHNQHPTTTSTLAGKPSLATGRL